MDEAPVPPLGGEEPDLRGERGDEGAAHRGGGREPGAPRDERRGQAPVAADERRHRGGGEERGDPGQRAGRAEEADGERGEGGEGERGGGVGGRAGALDEGAAQEPVDGGGDDLAADGLGVHRRRPLVLRGAGGGRDDRDRPAQRRERGGRRRLPLALAGERGPEQRRGGHLRVDAVARVGAPVERAEPADEDAPVLGERGRDVAEAQAAAGDAHVGAPAGEPRGRERQREDLPALGGVEVAQRVDAPVLLLLLRDAAQGGGGGGEAREGRREPPGRGAARGARQRGGQHHVPVREGALERGVLVGEAALERILQEQVERDHLRARPARLLDDRRERAPRDGVGAAREPDRVVVDRDERDVARGGLGRRGARGPRVVQHLLDPLDRAAPVQRGAAGDEAHGEPGEEGGAQPAERGGGHAGSLPQAIAGASPGSAPDAGRPGPGAPGPL